MTQAQLYNFEEEIDNQSISRKTLGYVYLRDAMDLSTLATNKMMDLYAQIAKKEKTTIANVERQLRYIKKRSRQFSLLTNRHMIISFHIKTFGY